MGKRLSIVGTVLVLTVPASMSFHAEAASEGTRLATAAQQERYRSTKIVGSVVRTPERRKLGVIKDLMLDPQRGEIAYAVLSFGGVLGVGEKYHAVPWTALAPSDDGHHYVLRADKEMIAGAPGFDKGKWPDMNDRTWSRKVDHYWSALVGTRAPGANGLAAPGTSAPSGSGRGR
ncbi:MAG TPA: PRC-barrel domain-containing protein [Noviherbaspirillum sp.]